MQKIMNSQMLDYNLISVDALSTSFKTDLIKVMFSCYLPADILTRVLQKCPLRFSPLSNVVTTEMLNLQ